MARSYRAKADGRAVEAVSAIKDALHAGDGAAALAQACAALRAEAAHRRRRHPVEAARLDAQLAGMLAGYAVLLRDCAPPAAASPLAVFQASFGQAVNGVTAVTGVAGGGRVG